ncbi:DUF3500 domain-containing protein [Planctomicrobium sp. SH664]|uniref:DUF3500 domain-containing protein n=1 Tax=Planctomicrobium sp. SH664 TaxID=3448125 RepID=UPI003F5C453A
MSEQRECPACDPLDTTVDRRAAVSRREFVKVTSGSALAAGLTAGLPATAARAGSQTKGASSENLVEQLYLSFTPEQHKKLCFDWDHQTKDRGLLRTFVAANWNITDHKKLHVGGPFFSKDQQEMIEAIFYGLYNPEWTDRIRQQLRDDAGGYGKSQTIAIFGKPGSDRFEFVMTGRHLTVRCDGNTTDHVAFGGPIFYGHASKGSPDAFNELPNHPGNVFWPQAVEANRLYQMLDGKQREQALVKFSPIETEVGFRSDAAKRDGLLISELSRDQKEHAQKVLALLLEPYRVADQEDARQCLKTQGGLDDCKISFYQEDDLGNDGVWDIWRIEGPSFVWHYRGAPHVHVWVNVADDPTLPANTNG